MSNQSFQVNFTKKVHFLNLGLTFMVDDGFKIYWVLDIIVLTLLQLTFRLTCL